MFIEPSYISRVQGKGAKSFGTCFIFKEDEKYSYAATCYHVLENILLEQIELCGNKNLKIDDIEILIANNIKAQIIKTDITKNGYDIAILRVPKLNDTQIPYINLCYDNIKDVHCIGYNDQKGQKYINKVLGSLSNFGYVESEMQNKRAGSWTFNINTDSSKLENGYSGSPVFDSNSEAIVGIVNMKYNNGNDGCVISIEVLNHLLENDITTISKDSKQNGYNFQKIKDFIVDKTESDINRIIFNPRYQEQYEIFYEERKHEIDNNISNLINSGKNFWIYGDSGIGKTTLITRNSLRLNIKIFYYYASSLIDIKCADDILSDLYSSIISSEYSNDIQPIEDTNIIRKIAKYLNIISNKQNIILIIDEIMIEDEAIFGEFVKKMIALSNSYNIENHYQGNIVFAISTINNPQKFCTNRVKTIENLMFIKLPKWEKDELTSFLNILLLALNIKIDVEKKVKLTDWANYPRDIKNALKLYQFDNNYDFSLIY